MNNLNKDQMIEDWILTLLRSRAPGKSICPSEAARKLFPDNWRERMEDIRDVARKLAKQGQIKITQGENTIDPDHIKGPIRLRLLQTT